MRVYITIDIIDYVTGIGNFKIFTDSPRWGVRNLELQLTCACAKM